MGFAYTTQSMGWDVMGCEKQKWIQNSLAVSFNCVQGRAAR